MKPLLLLLFCFVAKLMCENGPPGPIKFHQILECDPKVNTAAFKTTLKTSDNTDSLTMSFTLPQDYDESVLVTVLVEEFVNNRWEDSGYTTEDQGLFKFMNGFIAAIWENFKNQVNPKIEEENRIPAGSYIIENFKATYSDISTPQVPYGRFMASIYLTANDEDLICIKVEVEISPPSGNVK